MQETIKGVKPIRKRVVDGSIKIYYYHRATGHRLPDDPTSPAFRRLLDQANRQATARARPQRAGRTIATLIRAYQAAPDWKNLAASTQANVSSTCTHSLRRSGNSYALGA